MENKAIIHVGHEFASLEIEGEGVIAKDLFREHGGKKETLLYLVKLAGLRGANKIERNNLTQPA